MNLKDILNMFFGQKKVEIQPKSEPKPLKTINPITSPTEYGISNNFIKELIQLLGGNEFTEKKAEELEKIIWFALTNPINFDEVHEEYNSEMIGELGKPILEDWTTYSEKEDFTYFKHTIHNFLYDNNLKNSVDNTESVRSVLKNNPQTNKLEIFDYKKNEHWEDYLDRINKTVLVKYDKVALLFEFDIIFCLIDDKSKVQEMMKILGSNFYEVGK